MGTSSSHQAMRSEAVLLVLLAAPCVVESAAAFPKAVVDVNAVIKAMLKPPTAPTKKGLLAAADANKCWADYTKLAMKKAWMDDFTACTAVCITNNQLGTNAMAGTSTTSCATDPACTKFKKTCAAEAGWGFWVDDEQKVIVKDYSALPDSEHTLTYLKCFPSSCEGMQMPSYHGGGASGSNAYEVKKGTTTRKSGEYEGMDGVSASETIIIEQMPPPMWFYILIVVAVLSIALTVCLIKAGKCSCCGKCCPGGAKPATAVQTPVKE